MADSNPDRRKTAILAGAIYAATALAIFILGALASHQNLGSAGLGLIITLVVLAAIVLWLHFRTFHGRAWWNALSRAGKSVVTHELFPLAALIWVGLGLSLAGFSDLALAATHHGPSDALASAVLAGPLNLAVVFRGRHNNGGLALLGTLVLAALVAGLAAEHWQKIGTVAAGRDSDKRAKNTTSGVDFIDTIGPASDSRVLLKDTANQIVLARANLAEKPGGRKTSRLLSAPWEGPGIILGGTGGGKSTLIQSILLNIEEPEGGWCAANPGPRILITSNSPRDLPGHTVEWLRSQGATVSHFDLSQQTIGDTKYGDPVRWDPRSVLNYADPAERWTVAQNLAREMIYAARSDDSKPADQFWIGQISIILGSAMLAAYHGRESLAIAVQWASSWADPEFTEVDDRLGAIQATGENLEPDALRSWKQVRRSLSSAPAQGTATASTFDNLLAAFNNNLMHAATGDPNFDPRDWITADDFKPRVLFLSTAPSERSHTGRILFGALITTLVREATAWGQKQPNHEGRLPYRLWMILDEFGNLPRISEMSMLFSAGRKQGIQPIVILQSLSQLAREYSEAERDTIWTQSLATLVLSGTSRDADLITRLARTLGEVKEETHSRSEGDRYSSETLGEQYRPLVDANLLQTLQPVSLGPHDQEPLALSGAEKVHSPGTGLLIIARGVVRVETLIWPFENPWCSRGPAISNYHRAWLAKNRRAGDSLIRRAALRWQQMGELPPGPEETPTAPAPEPGTPAPTDDPSAWYATLASEASRHQPVGPPVLTAEEWPPQYTPENPPPWWGASAGSAESAPVEDQPRRPLRECVHPTSGPATPSEEITPPPVESVPVESVPEVTVPEQHPVQLPLFAGAGALEKVPRPAPRRGRPRKA